MVAAVVGAMLAGCGGDDPSLEEQMQGTWVVKAPGPYDCAEGLTLNKGRYVGQLFCALVAGGYGAELEAGAYSLQGNQLTMGYSDLSSCPTSDHGSVTAGISVEGDILTIAFPGIVLAMKRLPDEPASQAGVVRTGCWDDGQFTPFPVQKP
jgi:hypothetical protein